MFGFAETKLVFIYDICLSYGYFFLMMVCINFMLTLQNKYYSFIFTHVGHIQILIQSENLHNFKLFSFSYETK